MTHQNQQARDEVLEAARRLARGGYEDIDAMEEILLEQAQEIEPPLSAHELEAVVRETIAQAVAELIHEQAAWPALTDYDRLRAAFEALEAEDIVARENFTCCGTCGAAEIGDEIEGHRVATGRTPKGYVFFHQQDAESAVGDSTLYFNYGSADAEWSEERSLAIGRRLYEVLDAGGLKPDWNGTIGRRIAATIDWKRRWEHEIPEPKKR